MFVPVSASPALVDGDLAPGDVLRSEYGRTVRTVVAIDGDRVVLRTPRGSTDAIPLRSVKRFWRKVGSES